MTRNIPLAELHPHPGNPRLAPHQDVVDQIAAQLNGGMDEAHALIVRPNAAGYEILSGHHRCLAAIKAGLEAVPCHVREMSDADAYMALALCNAQRELTALERGFHALGIVEPSKPGRSVKAYAERVGRANEVRSVQREIIAATVAKQVGDIANTTTVHHLAELHAAPLWLWPALVAELVARDWTVEIARSKAAAFKEMPKPAAWADAEAIAVAVVSGVMKAAAIAKMEAAAVNAKLADADLKSALDAQLAIDRPATLSAVQAIVAVIEEQQAQRVRDQQEIERAKREAERASQIETEEADRLRALERERRLKGVTIQEWKTLDGITRADLLGGHGEATGINKQEGEAIEWAQWSWNPVIGCDHNCPYCYARDIATDKKFDSIYPDGFTPSLRPRALLAMRGKKPPKDAVSETRLRNVFTCSMADLFGRWVPAEWIEAVFAEMRAAPDWNFLCLTKFPKRISEFENPENAWMGTTVDLQARVAAAEAGFAKVKAGVRWLSVEPMLEPLRFKRMDLFQWIVIGGASASNNTPAWRPPFEWVADLVLQARESGTRIYFKTNLLGCSRDKMRWDFPESAGNYVGGNRILELPFDAPIKADPIEAPAIFHYLESGRR